MTRQAHGTTAQSAAARATSVRTSRRSMRASAVEVSVAQSAAKGAVRAMSRERPLRCPDSLRMQLGLYTIAETTPDPRTGLTVSPAQRLRDLIEEIELSDQVGPEVFGVGEHHRPD